MDKHRMQRPFAAIAVLAMASCAGCASSAVTRVNLPTLTMDSSTVQMTGMATGTLVAEEGCIRLTGAGGPSRLVIWPEGTRFIDGTQHHITFPSGKSVAVGESVTLGGGERSDLDPSMLARPAPDGCKGPYFIAADRIQ